MSDFYGEPGRVDLERSVRLLAPKEAYLLFNIANDIKSMTREAAAEVFYLEAIRLGVDDACLNLGYLYEDMGRLEMALAMHLEARARGDIKGAFAAGQLLERMDRLREARELYSHAISMPEASLRLARVLRRLGEEERAWTVICEGREASWEAAVEYVQDPRISIDEGVELLERHAAQGHLDVAVTLADLYEQDGRDSDAERTLRDAVARGDVYAMTNLGIFLEERGLVRESLVLWERGSELGDDLASRLLGEHGEE
ncbi:hypothetical protein ACTVCO_04705 [Sanguibacter sp. A247]|uniref:hypothetical protein n=1 Tax=unclassified Sanguibacter TaxID=2645534 RepID=UPI003FD8B63D